MDPQTKGNEISDRIVTDLSQKIKGQGSLLIHPMFVQEATLPTLQALTQNLSQKFRLPPNYQYQYVHATHKQNGRPNSFGDGVGIIYLANHADKIGSPKTAYIPTENGKERAVVTIQITPAELQKTIRLSSMHIDGNPNSPPDWK